MQPRQPEQTPIKTVPTEHKMKHITLFLAGNGRLSFVGRYLPERQTENWHYYLDNKGTIYHIRKEYMISVIEEMSK